MRRMLRSWQIEKAIKDAGDKLPANDKAPWKPRSPR